MATGLPTTAAPPAARTRRPPRLAVFSQVYGLGGPVAGLRWWFLARYLAAAGAEVVVFHQTADPGTWRGVAIAAGATPREVYVPEERPRLVRFALAANRLVTRLWGGRTGAVRSFAQAAAECLWLFAQPAGGLLKAFHEVYRDSLPDAVVAPFIGWAGVQAALGVGRRGVPLLLEFRDPWRQYHPYTWQYHERRIRRAVSRAAAVISVTPLLRERDEGEFGKPTLCLPHGFPPEVLDVPQSEPAPGPLRVGYFGSIFYPYFDHRTWFEGLAQTEPAVAEFHYAGGQHDRVRESAAQFGIAGRVNASLRIGVSEVFPRLRGMDVLLAFASTEPDDPELFGYKLAEVRAAGRPVLVVGPPNDAVKHFLSAATRVAWASTPAEVAAVLRSLAEEKRRHGAVPGEANESAARELGWDRVAGRLLRELDRLLPARAGR